MLCCRCTWALFRRAPRAILKNYSADEVHEGDAFITNHPYLGGSPHAPDMAVLSPIFYQGEWVGFAANLAHKSDIGGPVPGVAGVRREKFTRKDCMCRRSSTCKLIKTSKDIEALLGCNSRTPELVVGDLRGQVGAARLGERRFQEMMQRYGKETILDSFEQLFALTEAKVRTEIASWPDGVGEGERFVDSDGIELDKPVRLHVRMEKKGDRLYFDFTGCADQTKGPANIRPTIVRAACCYLLTCLVDPALAINYGLARCIDIKVRDGSVVNPRFPAPVNTYNPTVHALVESLLEASSQITPRKKVGDGCSSRSIIIGGRSNKTGKGYVQYEIFGGGSGGRSGKDGVSGTNVNQSNAKIAPIEIIESEFATRVRALRTDPGFRRSWPIPRRLGLRARVRSPRQRRALFPALDQTHGRAQRHRRRHGRQDRPLHVKSRQTRGTCHPLALFRSRASSRRSFQSRNSRRRRFGRSFAPRSRARAPRRAQRLRHAKKSARSLPRRHRRGGRRLCAERSRRRASFARRHEA